MPIQIRSLDIPDIKVIRTGQIADDRGTFSEIYNARDFAEAGLDLKFVQENHSRSPRAGTVRGLHFQGNPFAQDKLLRVTRGKGFDVAVDLRKSSRTFG